MNTYLKSHQSDLQSDKSRFNTRLQTTWEILTLLECHADTIKKEVCIEIFMFLTIVPDYEWIVPFYRTRVRF